MRDIFEAACEKDSTLKLHSERVAYLCGEIAKELDVSDDFISSIAISALFHDQGKMHIKSNILNKKDSLTVVEFEHIKGHPLLGLNTIKRHLFKGEHPYSLRQQQMIETISLTHHEQWDGDGYPLNLKGFEIPLEARICTYADIYDALRAERVYKQELDYLIALDEMKKLIGSSLDPQIFEAFLRAVSKHEEKLDHKFSYIK